MTGVPDPRDTVRAPANQHAGAGCRNGGRCAGSGWVQVTPAYAEKLMPIPPQPTLDNPDDMALWSAMAANIESRRRAAADSWYPCKDCAPAVFYRWAGGHLASDHQRAGCAECELAGERSPHRNHPDRSPIPVAVPASAVHEEF